MLRISVSAVAVLGLFACQIHDAAASPSTAHASSEARVASPDKSLLTTIEVVPSKGVWWRVEKDGKPLLAPSRMGITIDGADLGAGARLVSVHNGRIQRSYPFLGGRSRATENANTAVLELQTGAQRWKIEARAAAAGFAFRYIVGGEGHHVVNGEATTFRLPATSDAPQNTGRPVNALSNKEVQLNSVARSGQGRELAANLLDTGMGAASTKVWFGERNNAWKLQSYAGTWMSADVDAMPGISREGPVQGAPMVFRRLGGGFGVLCEAAGFNYSGLRFRAVGDQTFAADFTEGDKGFALEGTIVSPWRVVICADDLNELVNSTFVQNLVPAPDPELFADTGYIRPGRCVWRWQIRGTGMPADQKAYVDDAARLGYEFSLVDEGWERDWKPPMQQLASLCAYARPKNVGIFVWKRWGEVSSLADDYASLRGWLDAVKDAGASGIKVDFFNSENLETRRGEEKVLAEAAKRRLLVILHGCPKPTGEEIRYPNLLTREAVRGLELNFMNEGLLTPAHNAALPFTRCVLGPADYTPLTFQAQHRGKTTVAHQLATVLNIGSPLQVFTAFPEEMLNFSIPEVTAFLKAVPTVWDETRVLPGSEIGELAVLARRKGRDWFVAALNGGKARPYELKCDFLDSTPTSTVLLLDGKTPGDVTAERRSLQRGDSLSLPLAAGGGFVLWFQQPK